MASWPVRLNSTPHRPPLFVDPMPPVSGDLKLAWKRALVGTAVPLAGDVAQHERVLRRQRIDRAERVRVAVAKAQEPIDEERRPEAPPADEELRARRSSSARRAGDARGEVHLEEAPHGSQRERTHLSRF